MKITTMSGIAALALLAAVPVAAQPAPGGWQQNGPPPGAGPDSFWRGAPEGPRERIDFLQRRIDRAVADGSLDRREARRAQVELSTIRRDVMRMRGRMRPEDRAMVQDRLERLSQRIRWQRRDGGGYGGGPGGPGPGGPGGYGGPGGPGPGGPGGPGPDRFVTDYDASRHYRDGPDYRERRLSAQDEVYRGSDGRYYCKRNDGTTGLIVGAVGGGVLGNIIDGGHNRAAGTLIGGALGALAGKSIDQNSDVRCR